MMASYNEYLADLGRVPVKKPTSQEIVKGFKDTLAGLDVDLAANDAAVAEAEAAIAAANAATKEANTVTKAAQRAPGYTGVVDDLTEEDTSYQDAYERLRREFKAIGLESLVVDAKDFLMKGIKPADMPEALRGTRSYLDRFAGNEARIKAGLRALSPAEYLAKEDAYQNVMRQYGLPAEYYKPGINGKQENFEKLLASDIDDVELEERIATAQQRVLNTNPEVLKALKQFYPDIKDADILAYTLDPKNAIQNIKRKVTAAEIGGAALQQGLQALGGTAESLAGQGITKAQAQAGYANVAEMAPRGGELAAIYGQDPYTQQTAEAEVFNTAGAAEAVRKRKKLTELEKASFSGSSGVGALGRDRANSQSGAGAY